MTRHLIPAGHEFQKVLHDFNRLKNGQELFDREIETEIDSAADNNERFDILQRYREYVLPNYDDLRGVYEEVRTILVKAVELARATAETPVQTPFGQYRGKTTAEVVDEAMACFRYILYIDPELNFAVLSTLYLSATSDEERKHIADQVEALVSYNVSVWRQVGPQIQQQLTAHLLRKTDQELLAIFPLVTEVCAKSLEVEITGTSWNWNSVTFLRGQVAATDSLKEARSNAISVLKRLYIRSETEDHKNRIINALNRATRLPGQANADLRAIVLEDSIDIVAFYLDVVPDDILEIRERVENDLWWMFRRVGKRVGEDSRLSEIGERLRLDILAFRDKLNADEEFVRYKTLVGFKSVFPDAWIDEDFGYEKQRDYRKRKIADYVDSINEKNAFEWYRFVVRCAQTESNDLATFPAFTDFLQLAGEKRPFLFSERLDELDERLARFLPAMLLGLARSTDEEKALSIVDVWLDNNIHLEKITRFLAVKIDFDGDRLAKALNVGVRHRNLRAVLDILETALKRFDADKIRTKALFVEAIQFFSETEDARWVDEAWVYLEKDGLLGELDAQEVEVVLGSLVFRSTIDYHDEELLKIFAAATPDKVIKLFGRRLSREEELRGDQSETEETVENRYEPIPFSFGDLKDALKTYPRLILEEAAGWYARTSELFSYRGGRFVSNVFDEIDEETEKEFLRFIEPGNLNEIDMILAVLRNYEGETFLHGICRQIVIVLPEDDRERRVEVEVILQSTGVVSGEFGFAEAYQRKKTEIDSWLSDENQKVRAFASEYVWSLDRQIAADRRRGEQNIALRKLDYDPDDEDKD